MKPLKIVKKLQSNYTRTFESMGEGLLFIKVEDKSKSLPPYHFFFRDGRKPPFDIAVHPTTKCLSYFTFFLQDEKAKLLGISNKLIEIEGNLIFPTDLFSENIFEVSQQAEFEVLFDYNYLAIVIKNTTPVYKIIISKNLNILLSHEEVFVGVSFDVINEKELLAFKESMIID